MNFISGIVCDHNEYGLSSLKKWNTCRSDLSR